jgi:methyl-accepting chemotaxis protein
MTSRTRRLSVTLKLTGTVATGLLAVVIFLVVFFGLGQRRLLLESLERKASSLARLAAHDIGPGMEFDDKDAMREVLTGLQLDADVVYGGLVTADGARFIVDVSPTGKARPPVPRYDQLIGAPLVELQGDLVQSSAQVTSKGGTKGILVLLLTTEKLKAEAADAGKLSVGVGALALLFGLLISMALGRSFGRRIQLLADAAGLVAQGKLQGAPVKDDGEDEIGDVGRAFNQMLSSLQGLEDHVLRVARGDLTATTQLEGDLALAFNQMIMSQRELVKQIRDTALQVNTGAAEFLASARQQQQGATEQSSAVEETRRTMDNLLGASREIATRASGVLSNAERTQANSNVVASRIAALSKHAQRIQEILEIIKDIANKSDLLALNAALEGTKAGEVGRGFSLVATQMQKLAENVMGSVSDIKELTATISEATQSSVMATEESTKLASDTTRSAQQIMTVIQQQQSGTEQVTRAMDDVALIAGQSVAGSKQVVRSTEELLRLSTELQNQVSRFVIEGVAGSQATRSEARKP